MRVIQAANTSEFDNIDGMSCIDYWDNNAPNKQETIRFCRATGDSGTEEDRIVGGHVLGFDGDVPHVYITPILSSVNTSENPLTFDVDVSDLIQVPIEDERAIIIMDENKKRLHMLSTMLRMKELM